MRHFLLTASTVAVLALPVGSSLASDLSHRDDRSPLRPARFAVFSDPHFHSPILGTSGKAFEAYLAEDRKMLAESSAITEAAVDAIIATHPHFVLVAGDLTKDGELVNHLAFARQLQRLERHGIATYVIPGNHDINNPDARTFRGDESFPIRSVSPREFAAIYGFAGFWEAIDRDRHSLSYVAEPVRGLWLLALDSADYDDNYTLGMPVTGGRFKPETLDWIVRKLEHARKRGKRVIAMMHHGAVEHFTGQSLLFPDYVVDDWQTVARTLGNAGLRSIFTGHFHAQDAARLDWSDGGVARSLTDIETGSLVTAPSPYRLVSVDAAGALTIESHRIESIDRDLGGVPFQDYAAGFVYDGLLGLVQRQLADEFGVPEPLASELAPAIAAGFAAHYAGDESPGLEVLGTIEALKSSPLTLQLGYYVEWIWTDTGPADNTLKVP